MASLKKIPHDIVLDGELIVADSSGRSDFYKLKEYFKTGIGDPVYYVFDLLYLNGFSLSGVPLLLRKALLEEILPSLPNIKISTHIEKTGQAFFREAAKNGLEGIIAKDASSIYEPSTRSRSWLKIKVKHSQDIVIGGYIKGTGNRSFRSIVAGVYKNGRLVHVGNIGTGFSQDESKELFALFKKSTVSRSPFTGSIKDPDKIVWLKPEIVAETEFSDWTPDGFMRHPVFKGLRKDKGQKEVTMEKPDSPEKEDHRMHLDVHYRGKLSNPEKVFWPVEGYSKKVLFDYYSKISGYILPHIKARPQSLHRHPDGIEGESFFQKDINFKPPSWIDTFLVSDKEKKKEHTLSCLQG